MINQCFIDIQHQFGVFIWLFMLMVITENDQDGITNFKQHLFKHFQNKDTGRLKYFLGIEVAQSRSGRGLHRSVRFYVLSFRFIDFQFLNILT